MSSSIRLAACATHPIQYQAPIWRRLAAMPGVEFEAIFGTDMSVRGYVDKDFGTKVTWDTPLTAGYIHTFLSTDPRIQSAGASLSATGLLDHFRRFRPDVVLLTAYAGRFHVGALRAAKAVGAKVILRHEASDVAVARSRLKGVVRDFLLRRLYERIDGFAVIGTEARRHLLRLGVPESKMVSSPYCVDTDFFAGEVERWRPQRDTVRRELGIGPTDVVLVFSGKLVPKKDPLLIPAAVALLPPDQRARIHLLVAGDGELRADLERTGRTVLGERCHMLGFLNQTQIGRAYTAGDWLVLPSRRGAGETWGLVVNEAMQFGLGAIVSDGVGCTPDLVIEEVGSVFQTGEAAALAAEISKWVLATLVSSSSISESAQLVARRFRADVAADGIATAARRTKGNLCR